MARDQKITIITLNGFLGDERSFSEIKNLGYVNRPVVIKPSALDYPDWQGLIQKVTNQIQALTEDDKSYVLMGYSMGGRVLIEVISHLNLKSCQGIYFVSSNVGQNLADEAVQRRAFNQSCLQLLKEKGVEEFLSYWNTLPLFAYDTPKLELGWSSKDIEHFFNHWAISRELELSFAEDLQKKMHYCYGQFDERYKEQSQRFEKICPLGKVIEIPGRSHRLLQLEDLQNILAI